VPTLIQTVSATDRFLAWARPAWLWLGQVAVVVLGVHLAADRLDDHVLVGLQALGTSAWPEQATPAIVAGWVAVCVEIAVAGWATVALWRAWGRELPSRRQWWANRSVAAFVRPVFWVPTALAGSWVIGMAVQDLLSPISETGGLVVGVLLGSIAAWRLVWTGTLRIIAGSPSGKRLAGITTAPFLLAIAALSVGALPIWGWWG
jgi:hypothetical protein